ncbi:MAG: methylated-DNA--[protein]-cysteine S-methyltransferase [Kineosporiaceae bacterium]
MTVHAVVDSPVGPLTLVADQGALTGVFMDAQAHRPEGSRFGERVEPHPDGDADARVLAEAARQLEEYFAGGRREFDLPLAARGTAFQERVWAALREIPYGTTWSYGRLAEHIGAPGAARAVGLANGRNPIGIVVPCHRVIGASGALTGYGGGTERKRTLLALEAGQAAGAAATSTLW